MKVLLIDDEQSIRESAKTMIGHGDIELITANSPESAVRLLAQIKDIDVILTDFNMPGLDGMDWIEKLKKEFPDKKLGIITAYGIVQKVIKDVSVLKKPFSYKQLTDFIKTR